MKRRHFLQLGTLTGLGFLVACGDPTLTGDLNDLRKKNKPKTYTLLNPFDHPKFVVPLARPKSIDTAKGKTLKIDMKTKEQWLGLYGGEKGDKKLKTPVFTYEDSYPGPTIIAYQDNPVYVEWKNKLKKEPLLPIDPTVHIARPKKYMLENGYIPTVVHLHGGHTESASDGLPEAWFVQDNKEVGPTYQKKEYQYDNNQEAATLWYHDHALGITRLNVYAGLAGFYLLRDDNELAMIEDEVLPSGDYEHELVIQDRMFTEEGELFFPSTAESFYPPEEVPLEAPTPTVLPEFFGNFILVNGVVWPYFEVEPRKYRFRLLNGSDSRFYVLKLGNGMPFWQIGTDQGFLNKPIELNELLLAPGERADIVMDFSKASFGSSIVLQNLGPDGPFTGDMDDPSEGTTTGQIMQFIVNQKFNKKISEASLTLNTHLRGKWLDNLPQENAITRKLVLFEGVDSFGRLMPLLGTLEEGSLTWDDPLTETPKLNSTEVWEFYNTTMDAHPIHLHLVGFRLTSRQAFNGTVAAKIHHDHMGRLIEGGILVSSSVVKYGPKRYANQTNEDGWKDIIVAYPGEVTRVVAKFDRPGRFVWHCHILSHEDHEMMRPYEVV